MSAAASVNEVETTCSDLLSLYILMVLWPYMGTISSIQQCEGHKLFNKDWVCIWRIQSIFISCLATQPCAFPDHVYCFENGMLTKPVAMHHV